MIVMSIAGADPSAGAGICADLKTFQAIGVYGTGIITALTAQNPYTFYSTQEIPPEYIEEQFDSVLDAYEIEFIKTGMMYSPEIIKLVSQKIKEYDLKAVVDPVMVATSGGDLTKKDLSVEYTLYDKFKKFYGINDNKIRIYAKDYENSMLLDKTNGEVYNNKNYYSILRNTYELFNVKMVIYEPIYMTNASDFNWYYSSRNWIKVSEIKIKEYVNYIGGTYKSDNSKCL